MSWPKNINFDCNVKHQVTLNLGEDVAKDEFGHKNERDQATSKNPSQACICTNATFILPLAGLSMNVDS